MHVPVPDVAALVVGAITVTLTGFSIGELEKYLPRKMPSQHIQMTSTRINREPTPPVSLPG